MYRPPFDRLLLTVYSSSVVLIYYCCINVLSDNLSTLHSRRNTHRKAAALLRTGTEHYRDHKPSPNPVPIGYLTSLFFPPPSSFSSGLITSLCAIHGTGTSWKGDRFSGFACGRGKRGCDRSQFVLAVVSGRAKRAHPGGTRPARGWSRP